MGTIKKLRFLWKVWRRTLSIEEFSYLLSISETSCFSPQKKASKTAGWLLKLYFKHPLNPEEASLLFNQGHSTAQDIWLEAVKHRKMSDTEQDGLVRHMPWNFMRCFTTPLSDDYIAVLFAERNPQKIVAYCRDFALPNKFEKRLLEKYEQSRTTPDIKMQYRRISSMGLDGWAEALDAYLEGPYYTGERFATKERQKQLVELNDQHLTEKLIARCSIVKNNLHSDTMWALIEQNNVDALRLLLRESYLNGPYALINFFNEKMPQLEAQYCISQHRRNLYEVEQRCGKLFGALTFTEREERLVIKHSLTAPDEMDEFVETYIEPLMHTFGPCMCAYVAYHFPQLAQKALKCLQ
ncbi:MAG: hypothetical protein J6N45_00230 [Alphaproteobacteria bacterium]|nr:hypothetical protein [Alphaproteobacteria bacterium]